MNTTAILLELIVMSVGLVRQIATGKTQTGLEQELLALVRKGIEAYEAEVGKPLDPAIIKPIEPIP